MDPRTVPPPEMQTPETQTTIFTGHNACLFCGAPSTTGIHICNPFGVPKLTPLAHGRAGAEDAAKHLKEHAPAFVLEALGDALLALSGKEFTSESVRLLAERSEAVKSWLAVKGREACYGGWWVSRAELHHLVRTGESRRAQRPLARGRMLPVWKFPVARPSDVRVAK